MDKKFKGLGKRNLLLVDPDPAVRLWASRILTLEGFLVFEACDGHEAFLLSESLSLPLHLLLTDGVLDARLNGVDLARHLQILRPELRVLYLSAFPEDEAVRLDFESSLPGFLSKPLRGEKLLEKIASLLGSPNSPGPRRGPRGVFMGRTSDWRPAEKPVG